MTPLRLLLMHIMNSMAQNKTKKGQRRESWMSNEKIYSTMKAAGVKSLTLGIITLVTGIASGVLLIVSGAKLLKSKSDIMI